MIARMPTNDKFAASTRSVFRVLFRHKNKMIASFLAILGLVVVGLLVYPRSYRSEARLFVRLGKESVALDPTATLSQTVEVDGSRESEINSELDILRSRVLLEEVVGRLGADDILRTSSAASSGPSSWMESLLTPVSIASTWLSGEVSPEERAITRLEAMITVTPPRKSNIIAVKCLARDPHQAQRILDAFVDVYLVGHAKANRTPGSYEFLVVQSKLLEGQLQQATKELRDAKNDTRLVSIDGQRQHVLSEVGLIESVMLENQRALASSEAKIGALQKALSELPVQLVAEETAGLPNVAADTMRNELYKVQIEQAETTSRLNSKHPKVIALRNQVADVQKIHDEQQANRSQETRKLNVVYQSVQTELMVAQALAASQRAEAELLKQQHESVQLKIRKLNEDEFRITSLTRQTEMLEATFRTYTNNREQARIDQALETGRISNINVVQPPSYIAKPAAPSVRLTLLIGLVLAGVGAVLVVITAEYLDGSLKTPEQIEHELGIPVLLSVPRGVRHEVLQN